jgi:hypothetical protein
LDPPSPDPTKKRANRPSGSSLRRQFRKRRRSPRGRREIFLLKELIDSPRAERP